MRLRAILDAFRSSPRRGRRDIAPACVDVSAAARGGDSAARERVEFDRRRSVPAVDSASRHACRGVERGGGARWRRTRPCAQRCGARSRRFAANGIDIDARAPASRGLIPSPAFTRRATQRWIQRDADFPPPLRRALYALGRDEARVGGRARLGRRSARIAVRRGELCVTCGYADAVGGAAALFRTASRRSAAMRRAGRRDARAAYLRSSTTKS